MSSESLEWKVHTHGLFKEILSNPHMSLLNLPLNILLDILRQVAQRATELNDEKMNKLMIRLSLYSIANPDDSNYDPELVSKLLSHKITGEK